MKKIKTYIGIMAALLTMLTACSDSMVDNGVPSKNEIGTYQAHFTISVPNYSKVESRVANFATEGIASANDMKLLCFDKDGYFLGLARDLNIESVATNEIKDDGGSDKKNISATIPTGTARKGRRPEFLSAARPEIAIPMYEKFVAICREKGYHVETGEFGAYMEVESLNDGPFTLIVDSADLDAPKKQ